MRRGHSVSSTWEGVNSNLFKNSQVGSTCTLRAQLRKGEAVTVANNHLVLCLGGYSPVGGVRGTEQGAGVRRLHQQEGTRWLVVAGDADIDAHSNTYRC